MTDSARSKAADGPRVELRGAEATMLATLYGRALDARSPDPILGDMLAAETLDKINFDPTQTGLRPGDHYSVAMRAEFLDGWTREFLARHRSATVLHLGCGLDTRVWRVNPGPGVAWYDIDLPDVIALRRTLFGDRTGSTMIASSVTDPAWLAEVPQDRPTLVVAEGLVYYLTETGGRALLRRLVDSFPTGQMIFDGFSRLGIRLQRLNGAVHKAAATLHWGIDWPTELETIHWRLHCTDVVGVFDASDFSVLSTRYQVLAALGKNVPAMANMARYYRLDF
ncbi:class I SAM-dependent methyltransferase [Microlunatus sp. GCM10028923]|uniref:class I SAM-dependent methyltransferase n=1 Tax=Microlunatus sp. GCM10028923 TaxID=3273400 RepID=UPI00360C1492